MSNQKRDNERRKRSRFKGSIAEYAILVNNEDPEFKPCFLRDVSLGGVGILITNEKIDEQSLIAVKLYQEHSSTPIIITGLLVWSKKQFLGPTEKYAIGVKFLEGNEENRILLTRMIDYLELMKNKPSSITDIIDENRDKA